MAIQVKVPSLGESVKEATLLKWHKQDGEAVKVDEPLCELESDKANADLPAEAAGILRRLKKEGVTVSVGEVIGEIDPSGVAIAKPAKAVEQNKARGSTGLTTGGSSIPSPAPASSSATATLEDYSPAVRSLMVENQLDPKAIPATGPKGRLTKEDVETYLGKRGGNGETAAQQIAISKVEPPPPPLPVIAKKKDVATVSPSLPAPAQAIMYDSTGIHRAAMSKIRKRIAETLLLAQQTAAI